METKALINKLSLRLRLGHDLQILFFWGGIRISVCEGLQKVTHIKGCTARKNTIQTNHCGEELISYNWG